MTPTTRQGASEQAKRIDLKSLYTQHRTNHETHFATVQTCSPKTSVKKRYRGSSNPGPLAYACNYERPFHMFHSNIRTCTHPTSFIHRNDNKQAADYYTPVCGFLFLCVMTCKNSVCVLTSRKMSLALLAACETTYTNAGDGAATASMPMGRTTQGPDARGAVVVA